MVGIDYQETFALVTRMVRTQYYLSLVFARRWELHQMDVKNAFLHGN